jgi:hypothetical protein
MPTFLKNMSLCRVSFGFTDDVCGRIVLGDKYGDLVIGLPARRAYYLVDDKCDMLFTTNLKGHIEQFIKPSFRPGHRTIFDILEARKTLNKSNKEKSNCKPSIEAPTQQPSGKVSKMEFDKVVKTKEEILKENCDKIPNFVPWQPNK